MLCRSSHLFLLNSSVTYRTILIVFLILNLSCVPGSSCGWPWGIVGLVFSWIWFENILLKIAASESIRDVSSHCVFQVFISRIY